MKAIEAMVVKIDIAVIIEEKIKVVIQLILQKLYTIAARKDILLIAIQS